MGLLGLAEAIVYPLMDSQDQPWLAVALTFLAASAIVGRRIAPGSAAAAVGLAYGLGAIFDAPVAGGFWYVVTVGGLTLELATRAWSRSAVGGGLVMVAGIVLGSATSDPDNLGVNVLVLVVAAAGGIAARLSRWREWVAKQVTATRGAELAQATEAALSAERVVFARDLHDDVSHAVGLVAVQTGAAQVSWPHDPAVVAQALQVIQTTSATALAQLSRVASETGFRSVRSGDLAALVDRVRAAGTDVRVVGSLALTGPRGDVVYRVVQESLTNVVRHAPGASATVSVFEEADVVRVVVVDDGPGSGEGGTRGFGLVGLAERVDDAGGSFSCGDAADGGFRVSVQVPLALDEVGS